MTVQRVELKTSDNIAIVANLFPAEGPEGIILLHQLNLDRASWDVFAKRLQKQGFSVLALDLRGHGESAGSWRSFAAQEFQAMLLDVEAAASYLQSQRKSLAAVMGASIGANTAFRFSSRQKVPAVLLSPGLEYRGIDINTVTSTAPTLIIVAEGDMYSRDSAKELDDNNLFGEHRLLILPGKEHGTFLLSDERVVTAIDAFLADQRSTRTSR